MGRCEDGVGCDGCDSGLKPLVAVVGFGAKIWAAVTNWRVQCELM